jgi:hypothetical protein
VFFPSSVLLLYPNATNAAIVSPHKKDTAKISFFLLKIIFPPLCNLFFSVPQLIAENRNCIPEAVEIFKQIEGRE